MSGDGQRSPKLDRRSVAARRLAAGVFLLFELPLLLPVIVGFAATALATQVWS